MSMLYCHKCGKLISTRTIYCCRCGEEINASAAATYEQAVQERKRRLDRLLTGIAVTGIAVAVAYFFLP